MANKKNKGRLRTSLFINYVAFFVAILTATLTAFGLVLFTFLTGTWEDRQIQKLSENAVSIAELYSDSNIYSSEFCYAVSSVADAMNADIYISDFKGNLVFCNEIADNFNKSGEVTSCEKHRGIKVPGEVVTGILADGILATRTDFGDAFENEFLVAAKVVESKKGQQPDLIVYVVQGVDKGLLPYETSFLQIYISAAIGFIFITSLVVYIVTYNITKPLKEMLEATKKYSEGDFSYRIKRNSRNTVKEFDALSASVNAMAENLEQTENSRTQFVANVSHELKTPMTTIGGFIDGILDGTIGPAEQNHYLAIVSGEVKRLSGLVVSMLNMSKVEAGQLRINPERFNLTQQLIGIFMSFEQDIEDKQLKIKGLDLLQNVYIEADQGMINQVFYNLIDNAVKFTPVGGDIFATVEANQETVAVGIRNTGAGIEKEDIDHIFERFYKGDKSRSLDTKSFGLGLFIVKSIVNLHGGEIEVESELGRYTQFTVELKIKLK